MPSRFSDAQVRLVARLYYLDRLGQSEVARFVKVSQAKVSRLLAAARDRGIVHISVEDYEPRNRALERELCRQWGLKWVAVITLQDAPKDEDVRRMVGHFGASFVGGLLAPGTVVAVSGGRTVRELVQLVPNDKNRRLTVLQAMGSIDSTIGSEDAFELGRILALRSGGRFHAFNTPAFVPDRKTRNALLALPQIQAVHDQMTRADAALVGVGPVRNSIFELRGVLSASDVAELEACGAVGEICGRFYDRHGRECDSPWRDRVLSIDLEQVRKIPLVIGILAGGDRSAAIAAAIRGGLLKGLVTDEKTARLLAPAPVKRGGKRRV